MNDSEHVKHSSIFFMLGWFLYFSTALSIGSSIPVVDDRCVPVSVISRSCVVFAKYSLKISAILKGEKAQMEQWVYAQARHRNEVGVKQIFTFELAFQSYISQPFSRKRFLMKILLHLN